MAKRDPVIVMPDQPPPDEWIVGDQLILCIRNAYCVLTVESIEHGPVFNAGDFIKTVRNAAACQASITAYEQRMRKQPATNEQIWEAVVAFSKPK